MGDNQGAVRRGEHRHQDRVKDILVMLEEVRFISSTYAFLSRVVNAWLAKKEGEEPSYDAPVNKLALELPAFGGIGQTKIWVWRKK